MKYLLTIEANGDTAADAIRHARAVLESATHEGTPRGSVIGDARGSASATWRLLTLTDEGDATTALRRIGFTPRRQGPPTWLSQALYQGNGTPHL